MNKFNFAMSAMIVTLAAGGCQKDEGDQKIIEKPEVEITDGKLTPEVLEAFGRIGDAQTSPDGKKIVYASPIDDFNKNDEELFKDLPKTTGRVVDDLMYKHWDEWVSKIPHPFVADFDGNKIANAEDIMKGEPFECPMRPFGGAESFAWSPDSKPVSYTHLTLPTKA